MALIRIVSATPVNGFTVEMTLTTGEVIRRDLEPLMRGPIFDELRSDVDQFRRLRAEDGTIMWPNGADLCPDVLIWGGLPPAGASSCAA